MKKKEVECMNKVLDIVTSKGLTYEQKVVALAHAAENSLEVLEIPEKTRHYMETGRRPCAVPA